MGQLLLMDIHEISNCFANFQRRSRLLTAQSFDPVVILPKCMDWFYKNGVLVKKIAYFLGTVEKLENFNDS